MDPTAFKKIHPKEFYRKFLENSVRPSGRGLDHVRKTSIAVNTMEKLPGSSLVRVGNTTCVCGLKLEIGVPTATAPDDGRMVVSVNLGPLCSSKFSIGPASEQSVSIGQFLDDLITSSQVIDLSHLSIESGNSCWVVYADIMCLDYDGNVMDAALLALVSALGSLTIPATTTLSEEERKSNDNKTEVFINPKGETKKLKLYHYPIPLSFIMLEEFMLADPTSMEEDLSKSNWTVVYNNREELVTIYKPGGASITQARLKQCMKTCKERIPEVHKLYSAALS